jgi:integrase/recombinase XerD
MFFGKKRGTNMAVSNFERDLKLIGKKLQITGVRFSPHTLRHSFAVKYLRAGGNVFYLQRILGHDFGHDESVRTEHRIDDLKAVHSQLSLLAR